MMTTFAPAAESQSGRMTTQEKKRAWMVLSTVVLGWESAAGVSESLYRRGVCQRQHVPYITDVVKVRPRRDQLAATAVVGLVVYNHFRGRI